jgi:hypothetical protein
MVRYEGNGGGRELRRERKDIGKEERSKKREERDKDKRSTKQTPVQFHCFTVHFNSLCVIVQLMHLFVIKH